MAQEFRSKEALWERQRTTVARGSASESRGGSAAGQSGFPPGVLDLGVRGLGA